MADLTSLTELTVPTSDDLLYVVDAPATSRLPRKSTIANVLALAGAVELAYAEVVGTVQTTGTTVVDVTGCSITFTVGTRPVHIIGHLGGVSHSVAAAAVSGYITDAANTIVNAGRGYFYATVASAVGQIFMHERITAAGSTTRKLRFNGSASTASIMVGNLSSCFIMAVQL